MFILLGDMILRKDSVVTVISTGKNTCEVTYYTDATNTETDTYETDMSIENAAHILVSGQLPATMQRTLYGPTFDTQVSIDSIIKD